MRKRFVSLIVSTMIAMLLTGCAIPSIPELSENEEAVITEYAAGLMLKYSDSFESLVLDEEQLILAQQEEDEQRAKDEKAKQLAEDYINKINAAKKEKEDKKSDDKKSEGAVSSEPGVDTITNIADFYGIQGFEVVYSGLEVSDSYSDGGFMSVNSDEGKDLYIVHFTLANVSGQDAVFDIFDISSKFQLSVNGEKKVTADSTLLLNDLATYKDTIGAGQTVDTVLLFDIKEGVDPQSLQLYVKNGDRVATQTLQ